MANNDIKPSTNKIAKQKDAVILFVLLRKIEKISTMKADTLNTLIS